MTVDKVRECHNGKEVSVTFTPNEYKLFKKVFSHGEFANDDDLMTALGIYVAIKDLD